MNEPPKGKRGSWFAEFRGQRLPCVWKRWKTSDRYFDSGYEEGLGKWPRFLNALKAEETVLLTGYSETTDPNKKNGASLARKGYDSVWKIANITTDDSGLRFDFVCKLHVF